jgi:hypothetical protein
MAAWRDFGASATEGLPGIVGLPAESSTGTHARAEARPFRAESNHAQVNALAQDSLR